MPVTPMHEQTDAPTAERIGERVNVVGVTYTVGGRELLRSVTLQIRAGEAVRITGAHASGKSTLGLVLSGLLPQELSPSDVAGLPRAWRYLGGKLDYGAFRTPKRIAYLPPNPRDRLIFATVWEEMHLACSDVGKAIRGLADVKLPPRVIDSSVDNLSGGMLQRLVMAQALVEQVELLVIDETREWLDAEGECTLKKLIQDVCERGGAVLLLESDTSDPMPGIPTYRMSNGTLAGGLEQDSGWSPPPRDSVERHGPLVLSTEGVQKTYKSDHGAHVTGPAIDIHEGEWVGLTGRNGSGKSVCARILAGLERPDRGVVTLRGVPARPTLLRRRVGYVDQFPERQLGLAKLTHVLECTVPPSGREQVCAFWREQVHIEADTMVTALTPMQRRLAAVGILLARGIDVLVLDEPTWGADAAAMALLRRVLEAIEPERIALLLISHRSKLLQAWCSRCLEMPTAAAST